MKYSQRRIGGLLLGWGAALASGCADTDVNPPPNVVFAQLDLTTASLSIPLPNDLTGTPAPPTTPAFASFSGALDPASIRADDVLVIDLVTMMPVAGATASFDAATNRLIIMPPSGGWPLGHRIAIALRGGASGLKGAAGQPVVASPAFFFARSSMPIASCSMPTPGCTSATPILPLDQAIGLEQLRQALAPLVTGLEARGIPRDELVLAWTFTVSTSAAPRTDGGTTGATDAGADGSP